MDNLCSSPVWTKDNFLQNEDVFVRIGTWHRPRLHSRGAGTVQDDPSDVEGLDPYDLCRVDDPSSWMEITII